MIEVIVTTRVMTEGEVILEGALTKKQVRRQDAPPQFIEAKVASVLYNQKLLHDLPSGAYVTRDVIVQGTGLSDMIHEGEWAVSISLNGGAITSRLRPGDEIAIIGSFNFKVESNQTADFEEENTKTEQRQFTTVILPRVRIIALDGKRDQGGDDFVLALPPEQAQSLIAAQAHGVELSPALRRPHDPTNLKRSTLGRVEDNTFGRLIQESETIVLPDEASAR